MDEDKFFGRVAILIVVLNFAWLGFIAWAIYRLVMHFTGG